MDASGRKLGWSRLLDPVTKRKQTDWCNHLSQYPSAVVKRTGVCPFKGLASLSSLIFPFLSKGECIA